MVGRLRAQRVTGRAGADPCSDVHGRPASSEVVARAGICEYIWTLGRGFSARVGSCWVWGVPCRPAHGVTVCWCAWPPFVCGTLRRCGRSATLFVICCISLRYAPFRYLNGSLVCLWWRLGTRGSARCEEEKCGVGIGWSWYSVKEPRWRLRPRVASLSWERIIEVFWCRNLVRW